MRSMSLDVGTRTIGVAASDGDDRQRGGNNPSYQ